MRIRSVSKCFIAVLLVISLLPAGCEKKKEYLSQGTWIQMMSDSLGIVDYRQNTPYFPEADADSPYFQAVQSCVEWGILHTEEEFKPNEYTNRLMIAKTLSRLSDFETELIPFSDKQGIDDLRSASFAVHQGWLSAGKKFRPDRLVSKIEAEEALRKAKAWLNDPKIKENKGFIESSQPIKAVSYSLEETKFVPDNVKEGDLLYSTIDPLPEVKKAIMNDEEIVEMVPISWEEIAPSIDLAAQFEADFSSASVVEEPLAKTAAIVKEDNDSKETLQKLAAIKPGKLLENTLEYQGFTIHWKASAAGIRLTVTKSLGYGLSLNQEVKLFSIVPSIQWKSRSNEISHSFMKVDFKTSETLSIRALKAGQYLPELKGMDSNNWITQLTQSWHQRQDREETLIPIATFQLPIPNLPLFSVQLKLELIIKADGKIEVGLTQKHALGMEIKNNRLRLIQELSNDAKFNMKASLKTALDLRFVLKALQFSLADCGGEFGIKADIASVIKERGEDGKIKTVSSDVPLDLLFENKENRELYLCGNADLYWLAKVYLNSGYTLAGKLGFKGNWELLSKENGSLFKNGRRHIENWQFVEKCSHTSDSSIKPEISLSPNGQGIQIEKYAVILHPNEHAVIRIISLPSELKLEEIKFVSEDSSIAEVSSDGTIKAVGIGNTEIIISGPNNAYSIRCRVLVTKE